MSRRWWWVRWWLLLALGIGSFAYGVARMASVGVEAEPVVFMLLGAWIVGLEPQGEP